ncbi:hypothetical protein EVAR_36846_1 [Eumeta japonica]|uniref:Uncharacterized protein n=1 Tax=Eumeta variegata TaxID=151549 RepID=A0A4C1WD69_EUMVA|nr:hypothetical protein EVAR_36846_1 [Eumeta japonica]
MSITNRRIIIETSARNDVCLHVCAHSNGALSDIDFERIRRSSPRSDVSECSGGLLPSPSFFYSCSIHRYPFLSQEVGDALVTPLGLRIFMGGGDYLLSDGSPARFPFDYAL